VLYSVLWRPLCHPVSAAAPPRTAPLLPHVSPEPAGRIPGWSGRRGMTVVSVPPDCSEQSIPDSVS